MVLNLVFLFLCISFRFKKEGRKEERKKGRKEGRKERRGGRERGDTRKEGGWHGTV